MIRPPCPRLQRTGAFKQNPCSTLRISWTGSRRRPLYADAPVHRQDDRVRHDPGRIRGPPPSSRAWISSDHTASSLSGSSRHSGETSQPPDGDSRDRSLDFPLEGLTAPSENKLMMHIDTRHLQRRRDLPTGLGGRRGGAEAERDSGVTKVPEARAARLRRERPCPDASPAGRNAGDLQILLTALAANGDHGRSGRSSRQAFPQTPKKPAVTL